MSNITDFTNKEIITKYLNHYRHSKQSQNMRKSSLNYFFSEDYFGYEGDIKDISKSDLFDYHDYLNHKEDISLTTKENKWRILTSFIQWIMEYYDGFLTIIPSKTVSWKPNHKQANSNKNVVLTKEEIKKIWNYLELNNFKYYLIFRVFSETGARKSEIIDAKYDDVNIEKRYIKTTGKKGTKIYYISKELAELLEIHIKERKPRNPKPKNLFVTNRGNKYRSRAFNLYIQKHIKNIGIDKHVSCHTFRRSLNTERKKMGCSNEDRKILIGHAVQDVNINSYVKLNYKDFIKMFDKWNPYKF